MSSRAREYRGLIDDVVDGGLLEEDEWVEIRDLIRRIQRKLEAKMSEKETEENASP